jgi:hypothetical protein
VQGGAGGEVDVDVRLAPGGEASGGRGQGAQRPDVVLARPAVAIAQVREAAQRVAGGEPEQVDQAAPRRVVLEVVGPTRGAASRSTLAGRALASTRTRQPSSRSAATSR